MTLRPRAGIPAILLFAASFANAECGLANLDPIALDRNGNGEISRDEAAGTTLAWAFDNVDTDRNAVLSQAEFMARCNTYQSASVEAPRERTVVEEVAIGKAEEQKERQESRIGQRVDQEANNAVDGLIDRGLGKIFGR